MIKKTLCIFIILYNSFNFYYLVLPLVIEVRTGLSSCAFMRKIVYMNTNMVKDESIAKDRLLFHKQVQPKLKSLSRHDAYSELLKQILDTYPKSSFEVNASHLGLSFCFKLCSNMGLEFWFCSSRTDALLIST